MQVRLPKNDSLQRALLFEKQPRERGGGTVPLGGLSKRIFDVLVAAIALTLFSPLCVMLVLLLKVADPGPVLFRHKRVGYGSRSFDCLKFRTMVSNGDEVLARHLVASPESAREWDECRKLKIDPRVTNVGRVLRQLSLDELPQLWNVLRGEMSLVGPRPITLDELSMYGASRGHYLRTRPGLTGVWQVSGRSDLSYSDRVELDRQYVDSWSLWKDILIIAKTLPAVISRKGTC